MPETGAQAYQSLREQFELGRSYPLQWRLSQLDGLETMIIEREAEIVGALRADLGKPPVEAFAAEVAICLGEVRHLRRILPRFLKPKRVWTTKVAMPGRSSIHNQPRGAVLIFSAWNYPIHLALLPLIGAVAAGNAVCLKPSELAPESASLLAELIPQYLDPSMVHVERGGPDVSTALLDAPWDHIFFTGSERIGKLVMSAAAKHLSPLTLELGGKCPAIVDADSKIDVCARRIALSKYHNAGQTCVAPDYVLVHQSVYPSFCSALQRSTRQFFGQSPARSVDYGRIISTTHCERLAKLLEGQELLFGGELHLDKRYLSPTAVADPDPESPLMQQEIFGPILPIIPVDSVEDAIAFVNKRATPLAIYLFSNADKAVEQVQQRTQSGAITINHCFAHMGVHDLPFGGIGKSGFGQYHGIHSLRTFSHARAQLHKTQNFDPPFMYPPYNSLKQTLIRRIMTSKV